MATPSRADEPQRLTDDGRLKRDPVFLAGGEQLVYSVAESPQLFSLMRLSLEDGSVERLHSDASTSEFQASFSADGRYCAYVQLRAVTNVKLFLREGQSAGRLLFDPGSDRAHLGYPSVAPDASRVIFALPAAGGQQIVSINLEGGDLRHLTETATINDWPAFSPDGRQIAFGSSRDGNFEIYVMHRDGSNVRRLTHSAGSDLRPAWSPDGTWLAFTSNRDGNYEIYVIGVDGSGLQRITEHPERDDYPTWHPDGCRLAIVSQRKGQFDLYLVPIEQ